MNSRIEKSDRHLALSEMYPSCSGPCEQGSRKCNTPDACRISDQPLNRWDFVMAAFICAVLAMFVAAGPMCLEFLRSFL